MCHVYEGYASDEEFNRQMRDGPPAPVKSKEQQEKEEQERLDELNKRMNERIAYAKSVINW